ncbi:MAG TPA: hypothetical protein VGM51_01725 [Armatimonadota bacterium]|jgi:uncharacterized membrane protein
MKNARQFLAGIVSCFALNFAVIWCKLVMPWLFHWIPEWFVMIANVLIPMILLWKRQWAWAAGIVVGTFAAWGVLMLLIGASMG